MINYKSLYQTSQTQVTKLKKDVKLLQEQIRQRCQSYLIHKSKFNSNHSNAISSHLSTQSKQSQLLWKIQNKVIDLQILSYKSNQAQSQPIKTIQHQQIHKQSNSQTINHQTDKQIDSKSEQQKVAQLAGQRISSQKTSIPNNNSILPPQPQNHNGNIDGQVNWQDILSGYKKRIGQLQKQKSQLTTKVSHLQQQLKLSKNGNQSNTICQPTQNNHQENNNDILPTQDHFSHLWEAVQNQVNFDQCTTLQAKVNKVVSYIQDIQQKLSKSSQNQLGQQQANEKYCYNTPYRRLKHDQNNHDQSDIYQQKQIQLLKQKCLQLQAQLSKSKSQKKKQSPSTPIHQTSNLQKQDINQKDQTKLQLNQSPYIIQEQMEKTDGPYIKRSFVRKKIIKRNLSAMFLPSPSRTPQQTRQSMKHQLKQLQDHLQQSKNTQNETQVMQLSRKIQKLQKHLQLAQQKISQISDDGSSVARTSGASDQGFHQIIQVESSGPGFKNYTAHILGVNKKEKVTVGSKENNKSRDK